MNKIPHIKSLNPFAGISYSGFVSYCVPIRNIADYSPFGVQLDGRTIQGDFYRRGFNGMEKDDELKGGGNSYDFGARMYDARVGRWLSKDAHEAKYPNLNPYNFVSNNPNVYIDPDGKDIIIAFVWEYEGNPKISQLKYSNGKLYTLDGKKWNGNGIGKTFFNKVLKDLNDLKAIDSETNKVVEYLENKKTEVHYISNRENLVAGKKDGEEYDGTQIASKNRVLEDDDKSARPGSWTTYNAFSFKELYYDSMGADNDKDDKFRNPICVLGHELFHAFDRSKKTMEYGCYEIDGKFLNKREVAAVNFENIIRSKINETKRTKYSGITIPKSLLK